MQPADAFKTRFSPQLAELQAYAVPNRTGLLKLDMMESPFALPEDVHKALLQNLAYVHINRYPSAKLTSLAAKVRQVYQIDETLGMLFGNGSDELIQLVLLAFMQPSSADRPKVLAPAPSFSMYQLSAQTLGFEFVALDLNADFSMPEEDFLAQVRAERPAVIFMASPNNPTGNLYSQEFYRKLLLVAEDTHSFVIFDEAYGSYAEQTVLPLLNEFAHALLIRTFSKIGLAGIRLGYLLGQKMWIEQFEKLRLPFNINVFTQATARFMLEQTHYLDAQVERVKIQRQALYDWLNVQDRVKVFPSQTNFLLVRFADANNVFTRLRDQHQILVKNLHGSHPLLDNILRISIASEADNQRLQTALSDILHHA